MNMENTVHKVLLTGASGFVGQAVLKAIDNDHKVALLSRQPLLDLKNKVFIKEIDEQADFTEALADTNIVIHCAARVHVMEENVDDPEHEYNKVNTLGTLKLAKQAAAAGVKRFIFISSIKVNGEETYDKPFTASDPMEPQDFYGKSKAQAEKLLIKLSSESSMEVTIIRPPLIYGPGVKANFASLVKVVSTGLPLPVGMIKKNKRSMVFLQNLVDLIKITMHHKNAGNNVFLVSDDNDLSTFDLVKKIAAAQKKNAICLPIPSTVLTFLGRLIKKSSMVSRLIGSLQVDISKTRKMLDWSPPYTVEEGIAISLEKHKMNEKT